MLEKLVLAACRPSVLRTLVRDELKRLEEGGYVDAADIERAASDGLSALEGRVEQARSALGPAVTGLGRSMREALDIPSRTEVLALTEELRRARAAERAAAGEPSEDG